MDRFDDTDPVRLRERARGLRALASELEHTPAMSLAEVAGPETWQSPRADVCRWILGINQGQVHRAVEELRWTAHRFEISAVEIETLRARSWGGS